MNDARSSECNVQYDDRKVFKLAIMIYASFRGCAIGYAFTLSRRIIHTTESFQSIDMISCDTRTLVVREHSTQVGPLE
jgi:hypothetical protein